MATQFQTDLSELEVLRLEPTDVALAPQVEEDWGE